MQMCVEVGRVRVQVKLCLRASKRCCLPSLLRCLHIARPIPFPLPSSIFHPTNRPGGDVE